MNNLFTAESRRLVLRPFCERDLPALRRILTDEKTNVFLPWFPPCSERELRALAEKRFLPAQDAVRLAVCLKGPRLCDGGMRRADRQAARRAGAPSLSDGDAR